ncbi:MAG TPA: zinc-ribbon domain-containing protein [Thermoplasmata archaeon]|nr:zinc-ribbon domain-containing protein [Thermoplasmata archaeon]
MTWAQTGGLPLFCNKCGRQLPDGSVFCNFCGAQQGVIPQAAGAPMAPGMPPQAASGVQPYNPAAPVQAAATPPLPQNLKCNSCGAPLKPSTGLAVIVCEYCGAATTMGVSGAQVIQKHYMLASAIGQEQALNVGGQWLNKGILRRHVAEKSDLGNTILKFVPYWVVPTTIVADYQGTRGAGVAQMRSESTGGKLLGGALFALQAAAAANQNQNRNVQPQVQRVRDRIQIAKNIPVVAVRGYNKYQPEGGYEFNEAAKVAFDKRQSGGSEVMDGDVAEAEAKQLAGGQAQKIAEREAKKRVDTLESIQVFPTMADGELLHVPVWFMEYQFKGKPMFIAIDGNAGHVMNGERPAVALW